jgi:glutamate racemase
VDPRPIGVFDSGFGGLTVARAAIDLMPHEDLVYLGDTGRYPYGSRPLDEVRSFAGQIAGHLVDEYDVKLIVVACNTASAAGLDVIADQLPVPLIGVIDPGVRSLVAATTSGHVAVIGTVGTIASGAYQREVVEIAPEVKLTCAACPGFVEFVERGETDTDQALVLAQRLLSPLVDADIDTLLLGCTHYPFLARVIGEVMGRRVLLVSSAEETAFAVSALLAGSDLAASADRVGRHRFLSSGDVAWFRELGRRLLGPELDEVGSVSWA